MKTQTSTTWIAGLVPALIMALVLNIQAQSESKLPPPSTRDPKIAAPMPVLPGSEPSVMMPPGYPELSAGALLDFGADKRPPLRIQLSYWANEIVKLAQAGIEDNVMLAYLDGVGTFNLGAEEIIYLSDLGVSSQVITAMLQHDFEFAAGNRPATAWTMPSSQAPVRLTFITVSNAPAATGSTPAIIPPAPSVPAKSESFAWPEFSEITYVPYPETSWEAPSDSKPKLYAIRQPYPEKITDPILVFRSAGRVVNVQILEPFP